MRPPDLEMPQAAPAASLRSTPLLFAVSLAIFALLTAASFAIVGPQVHVDEGAFLLSAAGMAGKLTTSGINGYYSGYSLLIAPAFLLSGNPETIYRIVLVINALLVASTPFALFRLTRFLYPDIDPRWHVAAASGATCYSSFLVLSQYAMADSALVGVYAWMLACGATALFSRNIAFALLCGALAGMLLLIHPRGAVIALPCILAFASCALLHKEARGLAAGFVLAGTVIAILHGPVEHLAGKTGTMSSSYAPSVVAGRLGLAENWLWVALNFTGATTEAICASIGVFVIGLRAITRDLFSALVRRSPGLQSRTAVLLALLLGVGAGLLLSAVFFVPPQRADQIAYGRYALPTVVPLVAVGLLRFAHPIAERRKDALWAVGGGIACAAAMAFAFRSVAPTVASTWNYVNAVGLFLARRWLDLPNAWWSILICFIGGAAATYLLLLRSGRAALGAFAAFSLFIAVYGWCTLTWKYSHLYGDNRRIVSTVRAFAPVTGAPMCVSITQNVDLWHSVDFRWRLFPQTTSAAGLDHETCVHAIIDVLDRIGTHPGWIVLATEPPSPLGVGAVGLFVESDAATNRWIASRGAVTRDNLVALPESERHASIAGDSCGTSNVQVKPGLAAPMRLKVTNRSSETTWTPMPDVLHPISLGITAIDNFNRGTVFGRRIPFTKPLRPGESENVHIDLGPFPQPGSYHVKIAVVQELVAWFPDACEFDVEASNPL